MATFIGFNTIDQYKKFTLTDFNLIKRDLLNTFNIRQGEVPGRPDVGSTVWNLIFAPQAPETTQLLREEIERIVSLDPRIVLTDLQVYPQENGILIELGVDTVGNASASELLAVFLNQETGTARYV